MNIYVLLHTIFSRTARVVFCAQEIYWRMVFDLFLIIIIIIDDYQLLRVVYKFVTRKLRQN